MNFNTIEDKLEIKLPEYYKAFIKEKKSYDKEANPTSYFNILDNDKEVIYLNRELRNKGAFGKFKWSKSMFAIGCLQPFSTGLFYENNSIYFLLLGSEEPIIYAADCDKTSRNLKKAEYLTDFNALLRLAETHDKIINRRRNKESR